MKGLRLEMEKDFKNKISDAYNTPWSPGSS